MATASAQPGVYTCPACQEKFTNFKILPCAHILCRHCLVTWLQSDTNALCPICRDVLFQTSERAGQTCDAITGALPTDLAMQAARVARAAILSKSHVCGGCRNRTATAICLSCGDMLCATCTTTHGNLSATKHHKVENLLSLTAEDLAARRQMARLVHPDKDCELFCHNHGDTICQLCGACPEVSGLEESVQLLHPFLQHAHFRTSDAEKAGESTLDGAISQLDAYLSDMDTARRTSLADIERMQDRLRRFLDACCRRLKEQAQAPYSHAEQRVEQEKAALLKRRERMTSQWRLDERVGNGMPRVCDTTSGLRTALHSLDFEVTLPADLKMAPKRTVTINEKALERIEREMRHLCQLNRTPDLAVDFATPASRADSTPPVSRTDSTPVPRPDTTSPVSGADSSSRVSSSSSLPVPRNDSPLPASRVDSTSPVSSAYFTPVSPRVTSGALSTQAESQPHVWRFHTKHGGNIELRNDQQTAERVREHEGSIVMSAEAMLSNTLYEVKLDIRSCILPCGVTDGTPASLTLPKDPTAWTHAVFIGGMYVWQYGIKPRSQMDCPAPPGSRVALMVDTNNCLHLVVDGISNGVVARGIRRPCHAFFEVSGDNHVISTLPLRSVLGENSNEPPTLHQLSDF